MFLSNGSQPGSDHVEVIAKFNFNPTRDDELEVFKGQKIIVLEQSEDDWWRGRNDESGAEGWFPSNYVDMVNNVR